jgi:outer membrane murein-binding lipoprotein Lpp
MSACERTINLQFTNSVQAGFLDINQAISRLNRKLFRQGTEVMIESIAIQSYSGTADEVQIGRLPSSYTTSNAWVKALAEWNEQQIEAAKEAGTESNKAKWRDFKVYMNSDHVEAGGIANLLPQGYELADESADAESEWIYSQFVVPNTDVAGTPTPGDTQEYVMLYRS